MTAKAGVAGLVTIGVLMAAALIAGNGIGSTTGVIGDAAPVVPTARATRGSLDLVVHLNGDLRAARQVSLVAPSVGGALRVLSVADTGTSVAEGDVIMEFDPADQLYALEQAQSELREAEQEIVKRRAEIEAQRAQDKVALLTARFDLRRAELDVVVDPDLIPSNELKIRKVTLEEAKRKLVEIEKDIAQRLTTSQAGLAVLEERRTRATMSADRARQNMENLVIKAPMAGIVSVRENMDASGGIFFSGMSLPTIRIGDTVYSGRPIVDVVDISRMEIRAAVNEQERDNVAAGQAAVVTSNSIPGASFKAKVAAVAGLGRPDRSGPLRLFEVTLELDQPDPRLRPGTSVRIITRGKTVENVLLLPRQAVFEKDGKPIVYVRGAAGDFEAREIKILHRSETHVALDALDEGTEAALVNPEAAPKTATEAPKPTPAPAPPGVRR